MCKRAGSAENPVGASTTTQRGDRQQKNLARGLAELRFAFGGIHYMNPLMNPREIFVQLRYRFHLLNGIGDPVQQCVAKMTLAFCGKC
jgi:hypothetical protein